MCASLERQGASLEREGGGNEAGDRTPRAYVEEEGGFSWALSWGGQCCLWPYAYEYLSMTIRMIAFRGDVGDSRIYMYICIYI